MMILIIDAVPREKERVLVYFAFAEDNLGRVMEYAPSEPNMFGPLFMWRDPADNKMYGVHPGDWWVRLNPGSIWAVEWGCKCPVMDNRRGRGHHDVDGVPQYVQSADCWIHGGEH